MDEVMPGGPLRVLLVEPHALVRAGVCLLLAQEPGIRVVGEADDGAAAVRLFHRLCDDPGVDVVLTELALPDLNGAAVARRVKAHRPGVSVLAMSLHPEPGLDSAAQAAGADGYLPKEAAAVALPAALRAVARGRGR